ncbi:MAG: bifunctional glycosyltransferase family 2/GtrA family protein [Lachnospiraceae bacterium]|nr:bifunctional glycosyltransferase family 2/GtrA family protein [Lachnospiraceae bacterium]
MKTTVIVPSLNPDEKMVNTVKSILEEGFDDIIVVNDGSAPEYCGRFDEVAVLPGVTVLTHEVNRGKGRAMKTAFEYVLNNRQDILGVITVDADGQHLPKDMRACVEAMEAQPDKVILGVRDFSQPQVPFKSKAGNNITKAVFRFACGIKISDTQTGLRAIPYRHLPVMIGIEGDRYEYETNQLLVMKKQGIGFDEVVIDTVYIDDNASSHFHPFRDSMRIYMTILKFIGSSIASFLVDFVIFTILNLLIGDSMEETTRIAVATVGARIVSSIFNYTLNRKVVFKSDADMKKSLVRYFLLAICQVTVSFLLVDLIAEKWLGLGASFLESVIKMVVDLVLFMISYQIQQRWVFR